MNNRGPKRDVRIRVRDVEVHRQDGDMDLVIGLDLDKDISQDGERGKVVPFPWSPKRKPPAE